MHVPREARTLFIFVWIAGFSVSILILTYAFIYDREYVYLCACFAIERKIAHSV